MRRIASILRAFWPALVLIVVLGSGLASAQAPAPVPSTPSTPTPATVAPAVVAQRAKLEAVRIELDQLEAGLPRLGTSDAGLIQLRNNVAPLANQVRTVIDDLAPRGDAIRLRLNELGPKPDDKSPPEGADVTKEREDRQAALAEIDETVRLARALLVQAEQIEKEIADGRRSLFTKRLFEPSAGLLSPQLWLRVIDDLPQDIRALGFVLSDLVDRIVSQLGVAGALALAFAMVAVLVLIMGARRLALQFFKRDRLAGQPSDLQKVTTAAAIAVSGALLPTLAALLVYRVTSELNILPTRLVPVFGHVVGGLAFIAAVRGLADGVLAPGRLNWRLFALSDDRATALTNLATLIAGLLATSRVMEGLYQAMAAELRLTLLTKGLFAVAIALVLIRALPMIRSVEESDEEAFGPHVSQGADFTAIIRAVGWVLVSTIIGAALIGYMALASFLTNQIAWVSIVLISLVLAVRLTDECFSAAFAHRGALAGMFRSNIGLSQGKIEQIGVLVAGATRVMLVGMAVLMVLAPWGVESGDILSSMRAAFFGLTIAGVTISLSTMLAGVLIFLLGMGVTRSVQRWLHGTYFPRTQLDAGLRNSITMGIGYVGVLLAGVITASYIGLSLDRLTIVAGALSVGIGFGLQSIVNNFVSGLILLAERPIKVGDWIVVGTEQGHVRRINVRATQIETFDRATLIVPNSSLVSGSVKNWVHSDRTGRVLITVPVPRDTDADVVAAIMRKAAAENPDVLEDPAPRVLFKSITDATLTFDLVGFVAEVDTGARVSSDLTFAIFRRLREAGIGRAAGPPRLEIDGLLALRQDVQAIRDRMDGELRRKVEDEDPDFLPPPRPRPPAGSAA